MNIVLCGMMGVGKTSVGIKIASLSGRCWFDTDDVIVGRHGKISDIFEYYGEEHFRNIESDTIREIIQGDHLVVSTGGGLVLRPENVDVIKRNNGKIVYLRATENTLYTRLSPEDNSRPLLAKSTPESMKSRIRKLLSERAAIYEHVADAVVDTDGKTVEEVALEVLSCL